MARRPAARRSSSRSGGARRPSGSGRRSSDGSRRSSDGSRGSSSGSRRSASGSRGSAGAGRGRSGGRARGGGGGGSNATAIGVAVVLVVGVVALVVVMSGNKKKSKPATDYVSEINADSVVNDVDRGPQKPDRPPPPEISAEIIQDAKDVVAEAKLEQEKGDALYEEAMAAKRTGDEETWQAKLSEARGHYVNIREMWNERVEEAIMSELPSDSQWEADEVANHWLGKEAGKITKMLGKLGMITKQTRMK